MRAVLKPAEVGWFAGAQPRTERENAFLEAMRTRAAGWGVVGVSAASTLSSLLIEPVLYVECRVPGLPRNAGLDSLLQVGYTDDPEDPSLIGEWGTEGYVLDGGSVTGILHAVGLAAPPEVFGEWAADWMWRQLQRPIERVEFMKGRGDLVGSEWRLADNLQLLGKTGHWWRRGAATDRRVIRVGVGPSN